MVSLNKDVIYSRLLQDGDLVKMVLTEFMGDLPGQINKLRDAVSDENLDAVARQAHKIRGAAGNVGAEVLQHLMMEMESAQRHSEIKQLQALLARVDCEYVAVTNDIEKALAD